MGDLARMSYGNGGHSGRTFFRRSDHHLYTSLRPRSCAREIAGDEEESGVSEENKVHVRQVESIWGRRAKSTREGGGWRTCLTCLPCWPRTSVARAQERAHVVGGEFPCSHSKAAPRAVWTADSRRGDADSCGRTPAGGARESQSSWRRAQKVQSKILAGLSCTHDKTIG